jgi:hypothetical protein
MSMNYQHIESPVFTIDRQQLLELPEKEYQMVRKAAIESGKMSDDDFLLVDECRRMGHTTWEGARV